MIVYLAVALALSLFAFLAARWLTLGSGNNVDSLELLLGESITDRYRPMERLLRESDWQYLSKQPGFTPSRIRKIQAQRRAIFRRYMESMNGDFGALCLLVRSLMVQSAVDRPDLGAALTRIRTTYFLTVIRIQVSLLAQAAGIQSLNMDVSGLTRALEELGAQARTLQLVADPSLA